MGLTAILILTLVLSTHVSQATAAILGWAVLLALTRCVWFSASYERACRLSTRDWQRVARAELALFERIVAGSSFSAQLWTAAYYLAKIELDICYGRERA